MNLDYKTELTRFLSWALPRLVQVLDAPGAREVWLQGEAFRYFRHHRVDGPLHVWTNDHNRNDLAFYAVENGAEPDAVVEIKLFGLHYLQKNLTGHHNMEPFRQPKSGRRFVFSSEHATRCHPKEGSILKDYKKLLGQRGRRFILLILDTRHPANAFGEAIQRVDFGGPGLQVLESEQCSGTLWEIS